MQELPIDDTSSLAFAGITNDRIDTDGWRRSSRTSPPAAPTVCAEALGRHTHENLVPRGLRTPMDFDRE